MKETATATSTTNQSKIKRKKVKQANRRSKRKTLNDPKQKTCEGSTW